MKTIKLFTIACIAGACLIGSHSAIASQSCCVKAKAKGKDCAHPCCVEAHKAGKTCDKCQADPTCCDKAITQGKDCEHPCCVETAKEKKICEKCNSLKKKEAK